MKNNRNGVDNMLILKAIESVDKDKAVEAISHPQLDNTELLEILECSIMGKVTSKENGELLRLDNQVIMAGLKNALNQLKLESSSEI